MMTVPTRPAPSPPGQRGSAGANASLEHLRQQLQHQPHRTQQQNGGVQMLTIKLPPPPSNARNASNVTPLLGNSLHKKKNNNNSYSINKDNNGSSITRKFPQANVRYTPATSWDDLPFESSAAASTSTSGASNHNGNCKKVPPPRPPPPKVLSYQKKTIAPAPPQSVNILNNIFNRKKSSKAPTMPSNKTGRLTVAGVYGASSGTSNSTVITASSMATHNSSSSTKAYSSSSSFSTLTTHAAPSSALPQQEPQLISFDSPPSSPTFTQKSNSDCVSVDSFSSDSNFSSPNNGNASQPESGFEDDFSARSRSATSPLDPWETADAFSSNGNVSNYINSGAAVGTTIGTAPVRNLSIINTRIQSSSDNPLCNGKNLLPPAPSLAKPTIIKPKVSQKPKAPKPPALNNPLCTPDNSSLYFETGAVAATPPSPPMPLGAPPPPPPGAASVSLLDVISGKADALQLAQSGYHDLEAPAPPYGIALYNFDGVEDGDLSFRENEKIYLLNQVSEEWYYGRTRSGCEGIFPANYIDIKIPLAVSESLQTTPSSNSSNFSAQAATHSTTSHYEIPKVRCLYNFAAEVDGDLALKENDLVTILYKINEDWLFGEVDGRQGQFPANFLEYIPANIPMP